MTKTKRGAAAPAAPLGEPDPLPETPRLAAGVRLHPPAEEGAKWVVQRGGKYFRIGADAAHLLGHLDGRRNWQELAQVCGPAWRPEVVQGALRTFDEQGLLDGANGVPVRPTPWVKFVPPLTVQFTLVRPEALLARLRPLFTAMANPVTAAVAVALGLGGLIALVVQAQALQQAVGAPLPMGVYLWVTAGLLASTALHEMGHAAVLVRYGGIPSRIGIMLFYLMPAFFCDVSDGWRLGQLQRVRIALAGIATQCVVAGAVAVGSLAAGPGDARSGMLVFAVVAYLAGVFNLIPFVKLDGYIALMSRVDIPYLRDRAITDARSFLARVLFGGTYRRRLDQRWSVPYGLACLSLPIYLIATAAVLWLDLFNRSGALGASLIALGLGYAVLYAVRSVRRLVSDARAGGAPLWRIAAVATALAGCAAGAAFLPVPYTLAGGYVSEGDGTMLVLAPGADHELVTAGRQVELVRGGMVTETRIATAEIDSGSGHRTTAPVSVFVPVLLDADPEVPVTAYPVTVQGEVEHPAGTARVDAGEMPLWRFLHRSYILPLSDW